MSNKKDVANTSWSHRMTDEERRQAIEEALERRGSRFRLTAGQVLHIGRVERQIRESHTKTRLR